MVGLFLFALLMAIIAYMVYLSNSKSKTQKKEHIKKAKHYFDSLSKVLGRPYAPFVLSESDREHLKKSNYNPDAIYHLVSLIMIHLKAPFTRFNISITNSDGSNTAGQYHHDGSIPTITLLMKPEYAGEQIIAIVCHECMHHYLRVKKIKGKTEKVNELLTDYSAIYTGFGDILQKGYKKFEYGEKIVKVGYISEDEVIAAQECLKDYQT